MSIRAARRDVAALAEKEARAEQAVAAEDAVGVTGPSEEELACRQLVELVADYLDGLLRRR